MKYLISNIFLYLMIFVTINSCNHHSKQNLIQRNKIMKTENYDLNNENKVLFIIYVNNQQISKDFYKKILDIKPELDVPGMTQFKISSNTFLGIMPNEGILKLADKNNINDITPPANGTGIPRCEIYLFVDDPENKYEVLLKNGGKPLSNPLIRPWGDLVAYGIDPDGHIIALAKTVKN